MVPYPYRAEVNMKWISTDKDEKSRITAW